MAFEFDGEKYKRASGQQKAWGKCLIQELELKGHERILDLGCGDGALTAELAEYVPDGYVLGIDASESMIATARKYYTGSNLQFERQDINAVDFESEFDVVFSNATLHWIKDHKRLLRKVFECLRDRGTARFQFAGDGNCSNLIRIVRELMAENPYVGAFRDFDWPWYMPSCREYQTLLNETSFTEKKVWSNNADRYFESSESMTRWIGQPSLVPFLGCIPEPDRRGFQDAIVERMVGETQQADGTCFETFRRINVQARK
jgi:trans-aconitate methyltransferase